MFNLSSSAGEQYVIVSPKRKVPWPMSHIHCENWWWQLDCLWLPEFRRCWELVFHRQYHKGSELLWYLGGIIVLFWGICYCVFIALVKVSDFSLIMTPKHATKIKTAFFERNMVIISFLAQQFISFKPNLSYLGCCKEEGWPESANELISYEKNCFEGMEHD